MIDDARLKTALDSHQGGNLAEAMRLYSEVLRSDPKNFDALYLLGFAHLQRRDFAEGERLMGAALAVNPRALDALYNRGRALRELKRDADALACFDDMLAINPNIPEALFQRACVLADNRRLEEAIADYDKVVALAPDFLEAWNNRANALAALGRLEDAVASYDHALTLKPGDPRTLSHRAITLLELKSYEEAARDFAATLSADRAFPYARGNLVYSRLHCCEWQGLEAEQTALIADLRAGKRVLTPIQATAIVSSVSDQLQCSRIWTADQCPPAEPLWRGERYRHERIRLAYLSADFHSHATAALMAGVFEAHHKDHFEIIAISYGPDDASDMRARLKSAFERFVDAREMSDREIGLLLRTMEVDLTVDLKGYTQDSRPGILALRAAPVQAQYLGFPGTMGAGYVDYILADATAIPNEHVSQYSEKIVTLPDSYQCNDRARRIAPVTPSRANAGLPETGFVFCSFNNSFKIAPQVFDLWMRLLKQVEGSVLWLLEDNAAAARNLKREAERRGVAAARLVFAPRDNLDRHLARHRLAGLFLDTLPYGAHTTASDALWAGLPVLTCVGETFAGRVAASLLKAIGLPEMITHTLDDYEALALKLARDGGALSAIAQKLRANRETFPLFDTVRITRHLEAAYTQMWERSQRGEAPASFAVSRLP